VLVLKIDTPLYHVASGPDHLGMIGAGPQSHDERLMWLEGDLEGIGGRQRRVIPDVVTDMGAGAEPEVRETEGVVEFLVAPVAGHYSGPVSRPCDPHR